MLRKVGTCLCCSGCSSMAFCRSLRNHHNAFLAPCATLLHSTAAQTLSCGYASRASSWTTEPAQELLKRATCSCCCGCAATVLTGVLRSSGRQLQLQLAAAWKCSSSCTTLLLSRGTLLPS